MALLATLLALASLPALAAEGRFEKTLSVLPHGLLQVSTGAGNIHLTVSSGNQIHIVGIVKSSHCFGLCAGSGNADARVRQIAANPPIEQTGDMVHIGAHLDNLHNISIDYEIEAPAGITLEATSGAGDIIDDGVGANAHINTGSGNIHASGLSGGFSVSTGSGDIVADAASPGDVRAHTGSGNIKLRNLAGGLYAETGSGDVQLTGKPTSRWHITTGSGNVNFTAGSAAFNLDARTGSGDVKFEGAAHDATMDQVYSTHHSFSARIRGGGPMVEVHTGSGDVRID
uniref:DUF4097 domain-containing protein n=1 Tax=mine drainage metagenome TaxID=410659 RepID=E6PZ29_9ZZZZ